MNAEAALRASLEQLAEFEHEHGRRAGGYAYAGVHDFVLREGLWHPAPADQAAAVAPYPAGSPMHCFRDATMLAALHDLPYVEGYASADVATCLPVLHAWNLEGDGTVVDTTWAAAGVVGVAYLGVVLPWAPLRFDSRIDDWENDWPLLRAPLRTPVLA